MVKVAIIGGFLGAGKTTTMIQVGKKLVSEHNKRVVIITNDQGEVLVDTKIVKDLGFAAAEVLRGCFCCRFPDFVASAREMLVKVNPDMILAEPVGSCTDLPATVYTPLRQYYHRDFSLAPLTVLVDAYNILNLSRESSLLPPKSPGEYLYLHQIQEAEVIGINKIDLVTSQQLKHIKDFIRKLNDRVEILTFSAKTGAGLDKVLDQILGKEHDPYFYPEVDYDTYATAEAELGWFNGSWTITTGKELKVKEFVEDLLITTAKDMEKRGGEIAHLKLHLATDKGSTKASLVMLAQGVDFMGEIPDSVQDGSVIMNARVKLDPESVTQCVSEALRTVASKYGVEYSNWKADSFSPPPPKPYYRMNIRQIAVYKGPFKSVTDDDGHIFSRGEPVEVSTDTAKKLSRPPFKDFFIIKVRARKDGES